MQYEINYLILQSKTSDLAKIRGRVKELVESCKAKITEEQEFLKRKLAYEINHERFGFFTVLRFEIEDDFQKVIQEIQSRLNLSQEVARYIMVNTKEVPPLSEMNYKQDQEDKDATEQKTTLNQEEAQEILSNKQKEAEKEGKSEVAKKEEIIVKKSAEKSVEKSEKEEPKESTQKDTEKEEINEKKDEGKEKEKEGKKDKEDKRVSLDDLDDKLDEILNI